MSPDSGPPSFDSLVKLQIDYAGELNPQQHDAVMALPGPALVIAGAGAGKTRTLIYRVAFLLEDGIPALWGGTFHSVGNRILRRHADLLGYARDFTILDREDARDLIAACLDEAEIDLKDIDFPKADMLADIFSLAINTEKSVAQL